MDVDSQETHQMKPVVSGDLACTGKGRVDKNVVTGKKHTRKGVM